MAVERKQRRRPPRRATLLNFDWILERIRRQEVVREQLEQNDYSVDSESVASALLSNAKTD